MLLHVMIVFLLILTMISYNLSNKDYLSAPVILSATFLLAALICEPYTYKWYFDMSLTTFLVVMLGIVSFISFYYITLRKKRGSSEAVELSVPIYSVFSITWKGTILFTAFQIFVMFLCLQYINEIAATFNMTNSLSQKIIAYRLSVVANDGTLDIPPIPKLMAYSRKFAYIGSLFFVYRMAVIRAVSKKWDKKSIIIVICTIALSLLEGSRGAVLLNIVFPFLIVFYVYRMRMHAWKIHLTVRKLVIFFVVALIGMVVFYSSLIIVGRGDDIGLESIGELISASFEQLAIYLGAELKLLDIYLTQEYYPGTSMFFGEHTFSGFYDWLYLKLGIVTINNDFGFRTVNGIFLGNVYTMFRTYYTDAGFLGVILFSGIMGACFGYMYYKIRYIRFPYNKKAIDVWLLMYAYIYYSVALAFFSNWFYKEVVSITLLQGIISYFLFKYLFVKGTESLEEKK